MRTPQLMTALLAVAALAACNRAQTEQQAQRAAAEMKSAAAKAGETIADGWVTTRIQSQYFADEQVKARYVDVSTHDGVVTVKGFVESPTARERALQIARATSGVKQVNDQLLIGQSPKAFDAAQPVATSGTVQPAPATTRPDDAQVVSAIQAKYFLDGSIKARHINVEARNGVVTLRGEVASEAERAQALTLARTSDGVVRVEDTLTVNAGLDPSDSSARAAGTDGVAGIAGNIGNTATRDDALTSAVKARLGADPQTAGIDVSTKDGVVLLQGTTTARGRQQALTAARQTEGALQVVDWITVR